MKFIGLRLCDHDSNITYTCDNKVKYYKSERDYQIKHHGFNDLSQWIKIIKKWNINVKEIDAIGIVLDCPKNKNIKCNQEKLFENIDIPLFKLMGFDCPIFRIDHHYAHALSCWVLEKNTDIDFVFDGYGDDLISHSIFKENIRTLKYKIDTHNSLGKILGTLGKIINLSGLTIDHAGKLMALKGYGNSEKIQTKKYDLKSLDELWDLDYVQSIKHDHQKVCDHINFCHNITEEIYLNHFINNSNENEIISYSGGISQNTIINTKIKKVRKNLYIPPHCNDEGLSLGIVEFLRIYYEQDEFDRSGFPFWQSDESPTSKPSLETIKKTAKFLSEGKIVGWYQGNGEIGPRALGNRSILIDPSLKNGKSILNSKVKHREWFRPFGASILEEKTSCFFDWKDKSPYMLYVMNLKDKESFPSIAHVDGTCRIQTVSSQNEIYYSLIEEFEKITGIPMLLNTSLNDGGKPICGSISDSLEIFSKNDMDVLVIGDVIYEK